MLMALAHNAGGRDAYDEEQTATWVTAEELRTHVYAGNLQEIKWSAAALMAIDERGGGGLSAGCPTGSSTAMADG